MESLFDKRLLRLKKETTGNAVTWEIKLKIANLVYSNVLHLQATCGIQNQRKEVYCSYLDHTPHSIIVREAGPQFLTAVQSLKFFRLTQVYVWMVYPVLQFWECVLGTFSRETLIVTNAKESSRLIHILTIVYLSQLTTFRPTFPTVLTQPNSAYSKTLRH